MATPLENIIMENTRSEENAENSSQKETDKETLQTFIQQINEKLGERAKVRELNAKVLTPCPETTRCTNLDSSVKKNTAFVRKLKHFTATQLPSILADFSSLNLTKYVSEVAAAIVEAKLKISDVDSAVRLCNALHRNYADFSGLLFRNWQTALMIKKDAKDVNVSKLRVDLRVFSECVAAGVFPGRDGPAAVAAVLSRLCGCDKEQHNYAGVVVNFCRHCGHDFAGLVPSEICRIVRDLNVPLPTSPLTSEERQKNVRNVLLDYYRTLCKHLTHTHQKVVEFKAQNKKILQVREELSAERIATGEELAASRQRLTAAATSLADMLDKQPPRLQEDGGPDDDGSDDERLRVVGLGGWEQTAAGPDLWEDDETRRFYEELPIISGPHKEGKESPVEELPDVCQDPEDELLRRELREKRFELEDIVEENEDVDDEEEDVATSQDVSRDSAQDVSREDQTSQQNQKPNGAEQQDKTPNEAEKPNGNERARDGEKSQKVKKTRGPSGLEQRSAYLTDLVKCVNRDAIDKASVEFVDKFNTRPNRKRLSNALSGVSWRRLDLLPFYARLIATVHPLIPEVAVDVAATLKQDFKYHVRKKDQLKLQSKVKTVRFIGELVKFGMYSRIEALYCVKMLLADFTHHNVDMCCHLVETCGRFLARHAGSRERTDAYLDQMMLKKAVLPLDSRYATMIENAYFSARPPSVRPSPAAPLPPLHLFLRHVVAHRLSASTVDQAARLMARLDWDDGDTAAFAVACLTDAYRVKFLDVRYLAELVNSIVAQRAEVGVHVVDGVLEDIRLGLEENRSTFKQRLVSSVHYLGELYNYCLVDNAVIFDALYLLITSGVDPPDSLLRVRLVSTLLNACGRFFSRGAVARKLDCFLVFYRRYYWRKRDDECWAADGRRFPPMIDGLYRDTLARLRPVGKFCASYDEACEDVDALRRALATEMPDVYDVADESDERIETDDVDVKPLDEGETSCDVETSTLRGAVHIACAEDVEFQSELDRMVSENIHERLNETVKPADFSVPIQARHGRATRPNADRRCVSFTLMTRRGNKPAFKHVAVPFDSDLVVNLKHEEEVERVERQRLKRLTLDISKRLEEEEYREMVAAEQERRSHCQHQKGVPDSNSYFGMYVPS